VTIYELADTTAEQLLAQAASSGVTVRVILDQRYERNKNTAAYSYLSAHGVRVHWANLAYAATHQKTITVDNSTTAIMTLNLTSKYYATTRDFAVIENDTDDIAAIESTFEADFNDDAVTPPYGDGLVWSPTNAQSVILSVINSAKDSLLVENEEMSDSSIVSALMSAASRGVLVRVTMTNSDDEYSSEFSQLVASGAQVSTYSADSPLYIHAKVILSDYGSAAAQVLVGSQNFSRASLTENRELGLTLSDTAMMQSIAVTLAGDFDGGTRWLGANPSFSIQATPANLTINGGKSMNSTVTITALGGLNSSVALAAGRLPNGITASFTPAVIAAPGSGTSTLHLSAGASASGGAYAITITATGGGLTQTASLTLSVVVTDAVSTASFQPGFASGGWITILGTNLSPITDYWTNSIVNSVLPTSLDGVSVTIGGQPAYPEYISPTQINAVAPNIGPGTWPVIVSAPNSAIIEAMAAAQTVQPAFFEWGSYAVASHQDYSYAVKNGTFSETTVPAAPGDVIILWGTGFGPTIPSAPLGTVVPTGVTYYLAETVTVMLGNVPATVYSAVLAPGFAALYQVAIQIPDSLADGDYPVVATILGAQSPSNVLLTVLH
jgi:cardiolipin synthase